MCIKSKALKLIFYVLVILFVILRKSNGQDLNCCTEQYAWDEMNCVNPTTLGNVSYYCINIQSTSDTSNCLVSTTVQASQCSTCCEVNQETLHVSSDDYVHLGKYFSAWSLVLVIFAMSCFCCALVFLTAEQSRMKEGMSFQEAYLLPIPIVTAETDLENRHFNIPFDQPTAIARPHVSIDVPIAEPTEFSPLIYRSR